MNQEQFERAARQRWHDFSAALDAIEARKPKSLENFAGEYRALCRDLALAKTRRFDASLVDKLNDLALRGQQLLYQPRYSIVAAVLQFFARGFPQAVRRERAPVLFATLLFYGSALLMMSLIFYDPDLVFGVMSPSQVADIEGMYDPSSPHHLRPRGVDTDAAMFGFYIRNNMSIGFRTFAGGIFAGVGSLLLLLFNGIFLGAVVAHLSVVGFHTTLLPFIVGHGAFELTAITFSAAAGFRLGWALVDPGPHVRAHALVLAAHKALPLVYGSTGLLFGAACLEAFWSANRHIPTSTKYLVGALLWLGTLVYFLVAGRDHAD